MILLRYFCYVSSSDQDDHILSLRAKLYFVKVMGKSRQYVWTNLEEVRALLPT